MRTLRCRCSLRPAGPLIRQKYAAPDASGARRWGLIGERGERVKGFGPENNGLARCTAGDNVALGPMRAMPRIFTDSPGLASGCAPLRERRLQANAESAPTPSRGGRIGTVARTTFGLTTAAPLHD